LSSFPPFLCLSLLPRIFFPREEEEEEEGEEEEKTGLD